MENSNIDNRNPHLHHPRHQMRSLQTIRRNGYRMTRHHSLTAAAATLLILARCSTSDSDDDAEIEPIESLLATDIEIYADQ